VDVGEKSLKQLEAGRCGRKLHPVPDPLDIIEDGSDRIPRNGGCTQKISDDNGLGVTIIIEPLPDSL
jgi:hypothetical protein